MESGFLLFALAISTALAAHHVVDIMRALRCQRAQKKTVVVGGVQQDVNFGIDDAHIDTFLV